MQSQTDIYERRLSQLQGLTGETESPAFTEQVNKCIELSKEALIAFLDMAQHSMDHLRITESRKHELNERFGTFLKNLRNGKDGLSNESLPLETRQKMASALDGLLQETRNSYELDVNATKAEQETFQWCYERLEFVLFQEILLPDPDEFDVENALGHLRELIQKLMPYSEEHEQALEMNVLRNRHIELQSEDVLMRYLENFPVLLNIWLELAKAYKDFVVGRD